jgi:hypothetical protein
MTYDTVLALRGMASKPIPRGLGVSRTCLPIASLTLQGLNRSDHLALALIRPLIHAL